MKNDLINDIHSSAMFSKDRKNRYFLKRTWDRDKPVFVFIGLNPSTANEDENDPTIQSVIRIARNNGAGGILMLNLFAYISTDPKKLIINEADGANYLILTQFVNDYKVVCAWGNFKEAKAGVQDVEYLLPKELYCLGTNRDGSPKHPLYQKSDTKIIPFELNIRRRERLAEKLKEQIL